MIDPYAYPPRRLNPVAFSALVEDGKLYRIPVAAVAAYESNNTVKARREGGGQ
ncbi:hypothetical protein MKK55_28830 [Methylobacterium sp. J-059]|uniref:hypothetical protein n=1 Tax=Methylobacterium sp. J-059 TaxID=2836643 RepID=UPI001FBA526A|nr:hypothetical protein [Methylobacterium sp. J-059]MCJ2042922.1 hypothetical protein [Methylobacterium sp. J-059]